MKKFITSLLIIMIKIGLTGGIGVGKTYVAKIFENLGAPVFNADKEAKHCLNSDLQLMDSIKKMFGKNIYENNLLQTTLLANIVFNDKTKLEALNNLVHPVVKKKFSLWAKKQKSNFVIKEAAILFESNSHLNLDLVICVSAPKSLRISRIIQRDKLSISELEGRIKSQMPQKEKENLSNYVIYNDEKKMLLPQIIKIYNSI